MTFYKNTKIGAVAVTQYFSDPVDGHGGVSQHVHGDFDSGFG